MEIRVVPFDPRWTDSFLHERERLFDALGAVCRAVHHIGSTAVDGLCAKPIIDIMVEVTDLAQLDAVSDRIESHGYEAMGELGISGRRYFRKGGDQRTHQIHAFASGDSNLGRHLAFRDYLRAHPAIARDYGALKQQVAASCVDDIDRYCAGKDAFIQHHERLALKWARADC